jgi:flavorubredoxin
MDLHLLPTQPHPVARDTFVIPSLAAEPSGAFVGAHSLVIRGAEPVIVDTSCSLLRDDWAAKVFSVVDPEDVRWIFISHDDHDHIGNLPLVLDRCPHASLVGNWSITSRLAGDVPLPLERMRWLDAGESFDAGDRTLHLVRPPLFDSPATRGLFDPTTRTLWAVDTFGALVQGAVFEADDADPELYAESFRVFNQWNTPWLAWLDRGRFEQHLATSASLDAAVVASAHGPVLRGERIARAFADTAALAAEPVPPTPDQTVLDMLLAAALPAA